MLRLVPAILASLLLLNLLASVLILISIRASRGSGRFDPRLAMPDHLADLVGRQVPNLADIGLSGPLAGARVPRVEPTLIGFFSTGCAPCHVQAPEFARLAMTTVDSLAVVTGRGPDRSELVALLETSSVVPESSDADKIARTFGIDAFPTLIKLHRGKITAAGLNIRQIT